MCVFDMHTSIVDGWRECGRDSEFKQILQFKTKLQNYMFVRCLMAIIAKTMYRQVPSRVRGAVKMNIGGALHTCPQYVAAVRY